MLVTSLVTHCCEMASHSSTSIRRKSASVVVLVTLAWMVRPSWSHKCSMGLRSGLLAGYSILSTPKFGVEVVSEKPRCWDRYWYTLALRDTRHVMSCHCHNRLSLSMGSRGVAAGANPSLVSGRGQGTPWTSRQLITLMSNVGFRISLKDTSTCSSALPRAGIWTRDLPITSRPALPAELVI